MPIYEYRCEQCTHEFESLQKFNDDPLSECPNCQQEALIKLVSASSFRLKGGGWYETDFKTGTKKHGTQDSSPDSSSTDSETSAGKGRDVNNKGKGGENSKSTDSSSSSSTKADTAKSKSSATASKN